MKSCYHKSMSILVASIIGATALAQDPKLTRVLNGHTNAVMAAAFSPDGRILASGSADKTVRLWDLHTGKELALLKGHRHGVECVAFSPDGKTLASGASDSTIKLWDVRTYKEKGILLLGTSFVHDVVFSPDGKSIATRTGFNGVLKLWNVDTQKERVSLNRNRFPGLGHRISYFPGGEHLAAISGDGSLQFLNPKNGKTQFTLKSRKSKLEGLAISPDGKSFVFQGQIWDTETKKVRKELDKFGEGNVRGLSFSPDGKLLIGIRFTLLNPPGSSRETLALLELWDTDTGEKKSVVWKDRSSGGANFFVAFSPDGKYIATEGSQHNIMITALANLLHKNN